MTTLNLLSRGRPIKRLPRTIDIDTSSADATHLFDRLSKVTGLSKHRLRITYNDGSVISLRDQKGPLINYGLEDKSLIYVKDLGPQISWRFVFIIEYLGPLLIHSLFYVFPLRPYLYPHIDRTLVLNTPLTPVQTTLTTLITLHFLKRELETLFLHKFSSDTMPFLYIFRNSAHYWLLSGLLIAWPLYHPTSYIHNVTHSQLTTYITITLWTIAQLCNFKTHLILASLRPTGSTKRGIPHGYGFDWVTCANYGWETLGWILIYFYSGWDLFVGLFLIVAIYFMFIWGVKKEMRYRREFEGDYKKKKSVMIPFLL